MNVVFVIVVMLWVTLVLVIVTLSLVIDEWVLRDRNEASPLAQPPAKVVLGVSFTERERLDEEERTGIQRRIEKRKRAAQHRQDGALRNDSVTKTLLSWLDDLFRR